MNRPAAALLLTCALMGSAAPAYALGFVFAPNTAPLEIRSVLVTADRGPDALQVVTTLEVQGAASDLIWLFPLADTASVASTSGEPQATLEASSGLEVRLPASDPCPVLTAPSTSSGCSCGSDTPLPTGTATVVETPDATPPSTARATQDRSSTEPEYLRGVVATELLTRLEAAGVTTSSTTLAELQVYFTRPRDAVWWRMDSAPGQRQLPTLSVSYANDVQLKLPLMASRARAAPQLDLRVIITDAGPTLPENWVGVVPPVGELLFDGAWRTNYSAWVSRASAGGSGHFFAYESVSDAGDRVRTRLYARPAARDLDRDPAFRPHPQTGFRVPALLDLSGHASLQVCNETVLAREPQPCGHVYCGQRSECLVVDGEAACRCPEDTAATIIDSADGQPQVTCAAALGVRPEVLPDPCAGLDCGLGSCEASGSRALCACDAGAVAVLAAQGLSCVVADADAPTYGPGGGPESLAPASAFASLGLLSMLGLGLMLWRLRRRSCTG